VKFDDIRHAGNSEAKRPQFEPAHDVNVTARLGFLAVHAFVKDSAFGGETVFFPCLFNMDQSTTTFAVSKVR
jgi:hypothetical protein